MPISPLTLPSHSKHSCHDSRGGRAYVTAVNGSETLVQNRQHDANNQITEISGSAAWFEPPLYDAAGNTNDFPQPAAPGSDFICQYDAWNRLVKVFTQGGELADYWYDGLHRRVKKSVAASTRHYYYSDQWQVIEERVEVENEEIELVIDRQWVWGLRRLDDVVLRDRDTDADGDLDERLYGLSDALNLTAVVNTSGTVLERYGYNAFGGSRVMAADWSARSSSDYDWEVRFGGYRWDAETGLYQVRFRYLHPGLGRWLSRDPIEEEGGVNLLCYVSNNPGTYVDIYGRDWPYFSACYPPAKGSPPKCKLIWDCSITPLMLPTAKPAGWTFLKWGKTKTYWEITCIYSCLLWSIEGSGCPPSLFVGDLMLKKEVLRKTFPAPPPTNICPRKRYIVDAIW